jgi:hypothetical protein
MLPFFYVASVEKYLHLACNKHRFMYFRTLATRCFHSQKSTFLRYVEVVPALGESITEGSIARWMKTVGESVAIDDVIVVVETDKVTVDIKSTRSGVLTKQLATETV